MIIILIWVLLMMKNVDIQAIVVKNGLQFESSHKYQCQLSIWNDQYYRTTTDLSNNNDPSSIISIFKMLIISILKTNSYL